MGNNHTLYDTMQDTDFFSLSIPCHAISHISQNAVTVFVFLMIYMFPSLPFLDRSHVLCGKFIHIRIVSGWQHIGAYFLKSWFICAHK